jgi:hypothetical protein
MEETMSTTTAVPSGFSQRMLNEGYGPGAWHGPDLKAALGEVSPVLALWRPAPGRHNIAEIALHHAFCARNVHAEITGRQPPPFVLEGADWFAVASEKTLTWSAIREVVESEHQALLSSAAEIENGLWNSPLSESERFGRLLGITCHAVYHAGQIQLIKRLFAEAQ